MEYEHDGLRKAAIDFRIIKDTLKRGRFFKPEDLNSVTDLEKVTVFYQASQIQEDGVLLAKHHFANEGDFVGIVSADIPKSDTPYTAVFPFRVGGKNWGNIPLLISVVIFLQLLINFPGRQKIS